MTSVTALVKLAKAYLLPSVITTSAADGPHGPTLTNGPSITPNLSSPTGSKDPAAKRLRGIIAEITHES